MAEKKLKYATEGFMWQNNCNEEERPNYLPISK